MVFMKNIGNDTELDRILNRDFVSIARSGYLEVGDDKFCLPVYYRNYAEKIKKFEVNDDDVFITGQPKTGTTWTQEMVWLIVNNLDYAEASKDIILKRSPQLELAALFDFNHYLKGNDYLWMQDIFGFVVTSRRPRCIKTHLPWSLLPEQIQNGTKQPKIINVLRRAEDCCVSLYYHSQSVENYKGTFEDFCKLFLGGRVSFGPFWKQTLSYWQQRNRPNILFLKYKEMKDDLPVVIKKVAEFLERPLTEDQIDKLAKHLSFESMRENESVAMGSITRDLLSSGLATVGNKQVRSGTLGGFRSKMSPELIERFEAWTKENLAETELSVE